MIQLEKRYGFVKIAFPVFLFLIGYIQLILLFYIPNKSMNYAILLWAGIIFSCCGSILLLCELIKFQTIKVTTLILIIGTLIRIIVAIQSKATIDLNSWRLMGKAVLDNRDLYATKLVNWPPILPWLMAGLLAVADIINIPFTFLVRLPTILADVGIFLILKKISFNKRFSDNLVPTLFFLNPLVVIISVYHPQYPSVIFFFLVFAYYQITSSRNALSLQTTSLIAFATTIKHISLPSIISFFIYGKKNVWRYMMPLFTVILFLLFLFPYYIKNPQSVQSTVFHYTSRGGYWGIWGTIRDYFPEIYSKLTVYKVVFVMFTFGACSIVVYMAKMKKHSLLEGIQLSFLTFFLLSPGWAIQYLFWLLPFGALTVTGRLQYILYSIFGSLAYLEYFYGDWPLNPQGFLPVVYFICLWWFKTIWVGDRNEIKSRA